MAVLLDELHGARRSSWIAQGRGKAVTENRDVPNVIVDPSLKVAQEGLRQYEYTAALRARPQPPASAVDGNLVHRDVGKAVAVAGPVAAAVRAAINAVVGPHPQDAAGLHGYRVNRNAGQACSRGCPLGAAIDRLEKMRS